MFGDTEDVKVCQDELENKSQFEVVEDGMVMDKVVAEHREDVCGALNIVSSQQLG